MENKVGMKTKRPGQRITGQPEELIRGDELQLRKRAGEGEKTNEPGAKEKAENW